MLRTLTPGPSPKGRGEFIGDLLQHIFGVIEDDFVLETEDLQALRFQVGIPLLVVGLCLGGVVNLAVAFHDDAGFVAVEVADVIAELVLPTELRIAELPVPQQLPKHFLRRRLLLPQLPRPLHQSRK